jgi:lipoyl(octanoyl) transferase
MTEDGEQRTDRFPAASPPHRFRPQSSVRVRSLGRIDYAPAWQAMIDFTAARDGTTPDELWLCEHPSVYTLGQAGRPKHRLVDNGIPLVKTDRGGQITYHGPGQVVVYPLLDLDRRGLKVRELVRDLEQAVIDLLAGHGVAARRLEGAPGVYVDRGGDAAHPAKIAALGLRIRRGRSYHGLSLNVDMDLAPFLAINPCGYAGMSVTQTRDLGIELTPAQAGEALARHLIRRLESP